jgi:mevalonate kinase
MRNRLFPSKILLAGEYTVLSGHTALAIPWVQKYAKWEIREGTANQTLREFGEFIASHESLKSQFNHNAYFDFLHRGGFLYSTIPYGYGLGSSGSLCAALLDRFINVDHKTKADIHGILIHLESFFHGRSSGLDPMVSYFQKAVQIRNLELSFPDLDSENVMKRFNIQLIDSKVNRKTEGLVQHFLESLRMNSYQSIVQNYLVPHNELLIKNLIEGDVIHMEKNWKEISILSLEIFSDMIPAEIMPFWKEGIESDSYYTKLCGAGGGGLFLVLVKNKELFLQKSKAYLLERF